MCFYYTAERFENPALICWEKNNWRFQKGLVKGKTPFVVADKRGLFYGCVFTTLIELVIEF